MASLALGDEIHSTCRRSRRLALLQLRVADIATALGIDAKLIPSDQQDTDRLHAFRLLMHSEVQDYLEKIASNILDITEAKMSSSSSITHAAHHLIVTQAVASVSDRRNAARATYPLFRVADLRKDILATQELLIEAVKVHRKRIKDNSGIKFSNLQPLLQPLGYRTHFFSAVFRDKMDELGVARGEVAHASGAFVQNLPTGARELQRFADIEQGLSMIDRYVPRLLIPLW